MYLCDCRTEGLKMHPTLVDKKERCIQCGYYAIYNSNKNYRKRKAVPTMELHLPQRFKLIDTLTNITIRRI